MKAKIAKAHGLTWQRDDRGWRLAAPMSKVALLNYTKDLFDGWRICWGGSIVGPKFKTIDAAFSRAHLTIKPMLARDADAMEAKAHALIVDAAAVREMLK